MTDTATLGGNVECVICLKPVAFQDATAGSLYANGSQAFACNTHINERLRWTLAWITFDIGQDTANEKTAKANSR